MKKDHAMAMVAGLLALGSMYPAYDAEKIKRRGWKPTNTSATGSISTDERERRNKKRKAAKQSKRRNR